jgi:ubiquinone/menaquinone biosynthesis C-methylase UbiE
MVTDPNPHADHMADESMVRNLAAQAEAIWPQELPLLLRYPLPPDARILDAGCGTGEGTWRLAEAFPGAHVLGIDLLDAHLVRAREKAARFGDRVRFENRSIFEPGLPVGAFDLVVCRHVLQAVPHAEKAIAQLVQLVRPGGTVHLIPEDYGMIFFPHGEYDPGEIWPGVPKRVGEATGTDMLVGRRAPGILHALGVSDVRMDFVVVDTLRVPRETFARIWEAWRDGYVDVVAEYAGLSLSEARARWDDQIATIRITGTYAAWLVPVVSGTVAPSTR